MSVITEEISLTQKAASPKLTSETRLIVAFAAISVILIISGAGQPARAFYLIGASSLSLFLYFRKPITYISFVWWLWFLTPFVRRVLDYRSGWVDSDPILAGPLLASFACLPVLWRGSREGRSNTRLPFYLALAAAAYGSVIGVFSMPLLSLVIASVSWTAPILFGLCVLAEFSSNHKRPLIIHCLEKTFMWGLLLMGVYSAAQFSLVPAWDAMWLDQTANPAFGRPEQFAVRVFSTMASPLPLGVISFAGLVLLIPKKGLLPKVASLCGYISLLLCSVRSTWGMWAIGTAFVLGRRARLAGRFGASFALVVICLILALGYQPVRDVLQTRFLSLGSLNNDTSFQDRGAGYGEMYDYIFSNPLGRGVGAMDTQFVGKADIGARDSGLLAILICLGWFAGTTYFSSLAQIVWSSLKNSTSRSTFQIVAGSICIATVAQIALADISTGPSGMVLWTFAAITVAPAASHTLSDPRPLAA